MAAGRRNRRPAADAGHARWTCDTRVTALDRVAVAELANRAQADGFPVYLQLTPAGVPYVVLPRRWLVVLTAEEPDRWSFAAPSRSYLLRVLVPRHRTEPLLPAAARPRPDAAPAEPPTLGEEFRKWTW